MTCSDIVAILPAYNPGTALLRLVAALRGRLPLLIVNDGSEDAAVFERLPAGEGVTVLTHAANQGKGAALKTAFRHVVEHYPDAAGVITVDADGQHLPADVLTVASRLRERISSAPAPVFGVRRFDGAVPLRNRLGNLLTRAVVRVLLGVRLADTQTGLRGIPAPLLPALLAIPFSRYEFETEMLRTIKAARLDVEEVPIRTVYFEANRGSHFHPLLDSMRIYWVLFRHVLAGASAVAIDFGVYLAALALSGDVLASICLGRLFSLLVNFSLVKHFVFRSRRRGRRQFLLYLLQVALMAFVAAQLVEALWSVGGIVPAVSKLPVDLLLYPLNFVVQKWVIFRTPKHRPRCSLSGNGARDGKQREAGTPSAWSTTRVFTDHYFHLILQL